MSAASQSTVAAQPARWQVATGNVGIRDPGGELFPHVSMARGLGTTCSRCGE